jgi:phosphatidate cytidylyltransferase
VNTHIQRWLTALVAVPALVVVLSFGGERLFGLLIVLVIVAGTFEYHRLVFGKAFISEKIQGTVLAVVFPTVFYVGDAHQVLAILTLALLAGFLLGLPRKSGDHPDSLPGMKVGFGCCYLPLTLSHFIWLRRGDEGVLWIYFVIVLAFSGDVAAYYSGRTWGRRQLLPPVSTGKPVEGTLARVVGRTVCCILYSQFFLPGMAWWQSAILGLTGSALGQLGDLCESVIKRASGAKDSGAMLPGHGGILDRLDCLIFIVPYVYYYRQAFLA